MVFCGSPVPGPKEETMLEALSVRPRIREQIRSGPPGPLGQRLRRRTLDARVRDEHHAPVRPSRCDRLAGSAASRGDGHRRDAGHAIRDRAPPATVCDAPERPTLGCGRRRPFAGRSSVDTKYGCAQAIPRKRAPRRQVHYLTRPERDAPTSASCCAVVRPGNTLFRTTKCFASRRICVKDLGSYCTCSTQTLM